MPLRIPPRPAGKIAGADAGADVGAEAVAAGGLAAGVGFFVAGADAGRLRGAAHADRASPNVIRQAAGSSQVDRRVVVIRTSNDVGAILAGWGVLGIAVFRLPL
jgi:hypothetical protein